MICPFKRNTTTEIIYDFHRAEDRKPIKEITIVTFGDCEHCDCPFFNPGYDKCTFKGVIQK